MWTIERKWKITREREKGVKDNQNRTKQYNTLVLVGEIYQHYKKETNPTTGNKEIEQPWK